MFAVDVRRRGGAVGEGGGGERAGGQTVSFEQLAGLEEKGEEENRYSVHGSETCLREY